MPARQSPLSHPLVCQEWTRHASTNEAAVDPSQFPLHACVLEYRDHYRKQVANKDYRRDPNDLQTLLDGIKTALASGCTNPNTTDPLGRTALGLLVNDAIFETHRPEDAGLLVPAIRALMDAGANPLLHDGALAMALPHRGNGFQVGLAMLERIIHDEMAGRPWRDAQGGNALHLMVGEFPAKLQEMLDTKTNQGPLLPDLPERWWAQADDAGQQPLHRLWSKHSHVLRTLEAGVSIRDMWNIWTLMTALIQRGGGLLVQDHHGTMPAEGMLQAISAGVAVDFAITHMADQVRKSVDAARENTQMEHNTPPALRNTRKPGRI